MKLGYPCINYSIGYKSNSSFRLKSFSKEKFLLTVENNIHALQKTLEYNLENHFLFFRISSDLIPFASHPICTINWQSHFKNQLEDIGNFIQKHHMRISMHPSQFVLINATDEAIVTNSIRELTWHCELLDLMKLSYDAKVQIHVGGIYGDKSAAIARFIERYHILPVAIQKRLVIENDDRLFSLKDCLDIHNIIHIPIIFDNLHHECLNNNETLTDAISLATRTWGKEDGILMCDYSSQEKGKRVGKHAADLDESHFTKYLHDTRQYNFDIMLELKNKEKCALDAYQILKKVRLE